MSAYLFSIELAFAKVYRNRPISPAIAQYIREAYRINARLFRVRIPPFRIIICDNPSEWRKASSYYYFPFASGVVLRDSTMAVKGCRHGGYSSKRLRRVLIHEMNHVFWAACFSRPREIWEPFWLVEGLACLTDGGEKLWLAEELSRRLRATDDPARWLPYRYRSQLLPNKAAVKMRYSFWFHFTRFVAGKSPHRLVQVMQHARAEHGKRGFESAYQRIMLETLDESVLRFMKRLRRR